MLVAYLLGDVSFLAFFLDFEGDSRKQDDLLCLGILFDEADVSLKRCVVEGSPYLRCSRILSDLYREIVGFVQLSRDLGLFYGVGTVGELL